MNPLDYLRLQLRLEGKEIVYGNLLRQVEIVPDEDMPLMVIAQLADSNVVAYFDECFPLWEVLRKKVSEISFPDVDPLFTLLQNRNSAFEVGHYKTYTFPEMFVAFMDETVNCFSRHDPKVKDFGFSGFAEQVYTMEQAGKIVSACVSTRENEFCGEAWVYSDPEYRHKGFAQKVIGAWATKLIWSGKVPFYSHRIENIASTNLAKHLGLQPVFEEIVISYATP
jgi:RimJ/RimL family protein N-acetyltransferase